jgi:archaellum biogenesis ATPase FlaH
LIITDIDIRERVVPFLDIEIFDKIEHKKLIQGIQSFEQRYDSFPTVKDLNLYIKDVSILESLKESMSIEENEYKDEFLMGEIEDFFKAKLMYNNATEIVQSIKENNISILSSMPDKIRETMSFGFDTTIGLDYSNDCERMYDHLHSEDSVVSTGIRYLDRMIKGGFHEKSLTLFLAETNMGKSLIKCGLAVNALLQNKNVLYVTLEMSEDKISERVTANLFDVDLDDLIKISKDKFIERFKDVNNRVKSKLFIKEYPTRCCNTNHIRNLLKELELKKKFKPDIVFVDYLGIMLPNSPRREGNTNTELKIVSEELRGLAVEKGIPIVSALQTNRNGFASASLDLTDVADSIGTTTTGDIIIGVTQTEELRTEGVYNFMILKNRYGLNKVKCFVGVDYPKMRIEDAPNYENDNGSKSALDDASDMLKNAIKDNKSNGFNINMGD